MEVGDRVKVEEENFNRGVGGAYPTLTGPRMDIPTFEWDQPRWWIKWCEGVFYQYRVTERAKVNMAATYLDDVADAWFQN